MNVDDEERELEDKDEDGEDEEEDATDEKGSSSLLFICNNVPCDLWVRIVSILAVLRFKKIPVYESAFF